MQLLEVSVPAPKRLLPAWVVFVLVAYFGSASSLGLAVLILRVAPDSPTMGRLGTRCGASSQ